MSRTEKPPDLERGLDGESSDFLSCRFVLVFRISEGLLAFELEKGVSHEGPYQERPEEHGGYLVSMEGRGPISQCNMQE
jgi:hypothetical protein